MALACGRRFKPIEDWLRLVSISSGPSKNKENKVNLRTVLTSAALSAACLIGTGAAWAQAAPAAGAAGPAKSVGIINLRGAIGSTAEGKQASAELQSQFAPRTSELENIGKQIGELRQRLDAGQKTLSDEEKVRLQKQVDLLTRQGQR